VHFNKRLLNTALAIAVPLGMIGAFAVTGGVASAKGKKPPPQTISCSGITSKVTFTPPLVPGASTSKTEQTTISNSTLTGCTESPAAGTVTAATSVTATASPGKGGNSCATGLSSTKTKFVFTINWNNGGGTSTVSFKGSTLNNAPPGFTLSKGKVKGAFASKTAGITANLDGPSSAAAATCVGGSGPPLASVQVSTGSATA
jgi:hypothetical protein